MRALLICQQSRKRHPIPRYDFWHAYFGHGCDEAEIEWVEVPAVDWAEGMLYGRGDELEAWRTRAWEVTLDFVRRTRTRQPIDFVLSYLYPQQIDEGAVRELQRIAGPCVNFFCDNVREFHRVPQEYRGFALHWVPEFEALPMYRKAGLPHIHVPMPCWISPELRSVPREETEEPTFIGSADTLRRELIGLAARAGTGLVVRGEGWTDTTTEASHSTARKPLGQLLRNQLQHVRAHGLIGMYRKLEAKLCSVAISPPIGASLLPSVSAEEYVRITREAVVTIGINRVRTARSSNRSPAAYSRLRDIEAPMMGACYLTEWTQGLERLYDLGSEIESYKTAAEMRDKISALRGDPDRRRRLRERAQRRALSEHSVPRSLGTIRQHLGLGHKS